MKVRDKHGAEVLEVDQVLLSLIEPGHYSGGELEQLRSQIENLTKLFVTHIAPTLTLKQLNALAGFDRFVEVKKK
jgi:hypothetical protein